MKFDHYKTQFTQEALNVGYSEQNVQKCLSYAERLFTNNVPVIYNITHFAALVGYRQEYLKNAVTKTTQFYREFDVRKKNGTFRRISEPLPSLKDIQLWVLQNILYKVKVSPYAKAYKPTIKLTENVRFHLHQPKVLTLDLVNFFPSIKTKDVDRCFRQLGYSKLVANLLAKLCCKDGALPQGAPTSPYLSNIFFHPTDNLLSEYCKERKIRFTRYADDLSFSGNFNEKELLDVVNHAVKSIGMTINDEKTKLMTPNMRQTITGIVVNNKPQVVFHKRNEIRKSLYYIKKFGINDHILHQGIKQRNYYEHLIGKVNFVLHINPNDKEFKDYKAFLFALKQESLVLAE
jgi:RNA-directed DNA polymerase